MMFCVYGPNHMGCNPLTCPWLQGPNHEGYTPWSRFLAPAIWWQLQRLLRWDAEYRGSESLVNSSPQYRFPLRQWRQTLGDGQFYSKGHFWHFLKWTNPSLGLPNQSLGGSPGLDFCSHPAQYDVGKHVSPCNKILQWLQIFLLCQKPWWKSHCYSWQVK